MLIFLGDAGRSAFFRNKRPIWLYGRAQYRCFGSKVTSSTEAYFGDARCSQDRQQRKSENLLLTLKLQYHIDSFIKTPEFAESMLKYGDRKD